MSVALALGMALGIPGESEVSAQEPVRFVAYTVQVGAFRLGYGAFEILTIVMLTTVLLLYWRKPLSQCLLVAVVWSTLLAGAFRYVFTIPLPGSV